MKSETKNDPEQFIKNHDYLTNIIISIKNKVSFFPDMKKKEQGYYRELYYTELVNKIKEQYQDNIQLIAIKENQSIIYAIKEEQSIFICEGSYNKVSVSQIKMEFLGFIEEFKKQGKYKKIFASIFDW